MKKKSERATQRNKKLCESNLFNYDNGVLSVYIRTPGNTILNFYQNLYRI